MSSSSNSPSLAASAHPETVNLVASPNTPPMAPSSQKELVGDDASSSLSSLSSLSSVSSAIQPTTPVHSSATLQVMTSTPPSSVTCIGQPESPSEKLRISLESSGESWGANAGESWGANADATAVAGQQVSQLNEEATTDISNSQQPCSPSKPQTDLSHTSPQDVKTACSTKTPNPLQTTNVYINGLPPQFKAEQLYALASQFGTVLSCRTFTRQLSDHPSGYGFVLFDSIEAAQQCIDVLRSHHNLHPTFAKQAHKINRGAADSTVTSPSLVDSTPPQQQSTNVYSHQGTVSRNPTTPIAIDDSTSSGADIYIEGLPMNVDVPTLRILLAPHPVKSSRFFADTRVQPPRLVAFVKLESQAVAQDVRSKLHGRTIRGYSERLQVFSEADYALQLASTTTQVFSPQMASPRVAMPSGPTVASGLPMNMQDLFAESEDPFVSLSRGNKTKAQFMSPPFYSTSRFDGQPVLSPDNPRLQAALQQQNCQLPKQSFDQPCVPPQLQPLNATLNQLQAQLDNLRPLLYGYNSNHVNAVPNPFEMASPTLGKTHHRGANSYSDNRVFNNAFEVPMQSQNAATVTRSQDHDPTVVNGTAVSGRKQSTGSQLNPLAHAYSSMSGISANFDALNCLQSLTLGLTSGNCDTNTPAGVANGIGLGLGAPLFTHSGGSKSSNSTGGAFATRQAKNFSNGTNNVLKPFPSAVTNTVSAGSAGSGGRYGK